MCAQRISFSSLSQNELKAFFLNVYNALVSSRCNTLTRIFCGTVCFLAGDACDRRARPRQDRGQDSISTAYSRCNTLWYPYCCILFACQVPGSIGAFFRTNAYVIGGHTLSLDDIEHGILRGNKVRMRIHRSRDSCNDTRLKCDFFRCIQARNRVCLKLAMFGPRSLSWTLIRESTLRWLVETLNAPLSTSVLLTRCDAGMRCERLPANQSVPPRQHRTGTEYSDERVL